MVAMIIGIVVIIAFGIFVFWYLFARSSETTTVTRADFDAEYDQLVADGQAREEDRDSAWTTFHGAQLRDQRDRLAWEEGLGE
jgi:hypothetical protein